MDGLLAEKRAARHAVRGKHTSVRFKMYEQLSSNLLQPLQAMQVIVRGTRGNARCPQKLYPCKEKTHGIPISSQSSIWHNQLCSCLSHYTATQCKQSSHLLRRLFLLHPHHRDRSIYEQRGATRCLRHKLTEAS